MSQVFLEIHNEGIYKNKIISQNYKTKKNSKLKQYKNRNHSLLNKTPTEKSIPYKINYTNTETNFPSNNIHLNIKSAKLKTKAEANIKRLNEIQLDSQNMKIMNYNITKKSENNINKHRISSANILKDNKRISILNKHNINKKQAEINLNSFMDKSISENKTKRLTSSMGFMRKAEAETEKILKYKKKKDNSSIGKRQNNHIKNLDLNIHEKNNFKYNYVSTEQSQNTKKIGIYYDLFMRYNYLTNREMPKKLKKIEDKKNNLISIINNMTRKVQFLNTRNDILSNEYAMNLLNKEEYFLYQKLKEFFKENYSIKKFSKSVFDRKNGNKYLLPLFNEINFSNSKNNEKSEEEKNEVDDYFNRKEILELYFNNQLSKQNQNNYINNIYFPSKKDKLTFGTPNQDVLKTNKSFDKNYYLDNISKKPNINKQIVLLTKPNKNHKQLIEKKHYQDYKMRVIQENEKIINNYHKKSNYSTKAFLRIKTNQNKNLYHIIPIKRRNIKKIEDVNDIIENNLFKQKKEKEKEMTKLVEKEDISSKYKKIKTSNSEKKQIIKSKEINEDIKISKKKVKSKINNKIKDDNKKDLIPINNNQSNSSKKILNKNTEKKETEDIKKVIGLSTKNIDENSPIQKDKKIPNNEDIKEVLLKENNIFSEFARIYKNNHPIVSYKNNNNDNDDNNDNQNKNKSNVKMELEKIPKNQKNISKTIDTNKKEENNINIDLRNITISNNMILRENLKKEENKLMIQTEKKKEKTMKLIYAYIKEHIKGLIGKDKIKQLLTKPEFRTNFDLLKSQINKIKEIAHNNAPDGKKFQNLLDDDIINIIFDEINKQNIKKVEVNIQKSSYIPSLRLKKRHSTRKRKEEKKDEKKEEIKEVHKNLEKENEKLELMATEISFANELKQHIKETYNKEFRDRFKVILDKIEALQQLSAEEYVANFKSNYNSLKEEMMQILSDKDREERINIFMSNLDSERNTFEKKWTFCNNKINVIDNKFEISLGKYQSYKIPKKKYK